jgi:peptidoglycan/xylan/chitin deacetylase (PgdA/CDA1 family)
VSNSGLKRTLISSAARAPGFALGVTVAERVAPVRTATLSILTYHRVAEPWSTPELDPRLVSATPDGFREQMTILARSYDFLSIADLLAIRRGERDVTSRALMLTFDDAYSDFAEHAWPVLRDLRLPVTLFVPTAFPGDAGRSFWWDRVHGALMTAAEQSVETPFGPCSLATPAHRSRAVRFVQHRLTQLPHDELVETVDALCDSLAARPARGSVLSWSQLRELAAEGVTLAPHTQTHALLDQVTAQRARVEITGAVRELERQVGTCARVFAYPGGAYTREVVELLEQEGFELGVTTERGVNRIDSVDWLRLRRINVGQRSNAALIRAQIALFSRRRPREPAVQRCH